MMLKEISSIKYKRGAIYVLETNNEDTIEVYHTTYDRDFGLDRVIEVSTWAGCPCQCLFCATAKLPFCRPLSTGEITSQVEFILSHPGNDFDQNNVRRINYTRMGEPFLNIREVKKAIATLQQKMPETKHYISTIGIRGSDFSFITEKIALQLSVHSLEEDHRNYLMPYKGKMALKELGQIRTPRSYQKPTINLITSFWHCGFSKLLQQYFEPSEFFIKFTPLNVNSRTKEINYGASTRSARVGVL